MDGQDFEGWTRSASGGSKVTTAPIVPEGKEYVDLYAQWDEAEPKTVTLNFVTNGGSRIDDVKVKYSARVDLDGICDRTRGLRLRRLVLRPLADEARDQPSHVR